MLPLLRVQLLHVYRSRLIILGIVAGVLLELGGLSLLKNISMSFNDTVASIGWKQSLFLAIFSQLFTGSFIASAAGIWLLPYPHQGLRAVLTYVTPISPAKIAGSQLLLVLLLTAVQFLLGLGVFAFSTGLDPFRSGEFPWGGAMTCLGLATIAGATLAFWLAAVSMRLGAVAAFLGSSFVLTGLQIYGTVVRIGSSNYFEQFAETMARWKKIYLFLPPFGDIVFNIREQLFKADGAEAIPWIGWVAWLLLGILAFTFSQKAQLNRRSVA